MMKQLLNTILALTLLMSIGLAQETGDIAVNASVLAVLTLTPGNDLNFGNISATSTPILDPKTPANNTDLGTTNNAGTYTLAGEASATVSVTYDASVTLSNGATGSLTFTPDMYGHTANDASASSSVASASTITLGSGDPAYYFWLGGDLGTLSSQETGTYTGNFTLTLEYQ